MNQPASPGARKGATWIGIAVVGAALVGTASYYFDIPPRGDNLTGTVTPAQRYRSEQHTLRIEDIAGNGNSILDGRSPGRRS